MLCENTYYPDGNEKEKPNCRKMKETEYFTGIDCSECPFFMKVCGLGQVKFHVYEAIEIVEQWAKEHPIVNNAMKFKEVFGTGGAEGMCICDDGECGVQAKFWNAEYKEQAKEGDE